MITLTSTFYPLLNDYLMNDPGFIWSNYQIWRLFTAAFVQYNLISLFIALLVFYPMSQTHEKIRGTVGYFIFFWWMTVISQIFILLIYVLSLEYKNFTAISDGLWTMILIEMTIDSIKNANSPRYF